MAELFDMKELEERVILVAVSSLLFVSFNTL